MLGDRRWITGSESLSTLMSSAGLDAKVIVTEEYDDIPARTDVREKMREGGFLISVRERRGRG